MFNVYARFARRVPGHIVSQGSFQSTEQEGTYMKTQQLPMSVKERIEPICGLWLLDVVSTVISEEDAQGD